MNTNNLNNKLLNDKHETERQLQRILTKNNIPLSIQDSVYIPEEHYNNNSDIQNLKQFSTLSRVVSEHRNNGNNVQIFSHDNFPQHTFIANPININNVIPRSSVSSSSQCVSGKTTLTRNTSSSQYKKQPLQIHSSKNYLEERGYSSNTLDKDAYSSCSSSSCNNLPPPNLHDEHLMSTLSNNMSLIEHRLAKNRSLSAISIDQSTSASSLAYNKKRRGGRKGRSNKYKSQQEEQSNSEEIASPVTNINNQLLQLQIN